MGAPLYCGAPVLIVEELPVMFCSHTWKLKACLVTVVIVLAVVGCETTQKVPDNEEEKIAELHVGIGYQKTEELISQLMGFADAHAARTYRSYDELKQTTSNPEIRKWAYHAQIENISRTYIIATESNTAAALLDMVASIQLTRTYIEKRIVPELLGEEGKDVLTVHQESEEQIWRIAKTVLTEDQQKQLRNLIEMFWETNQDDRYLGLAQFTDLTRQSGKDGSFSILGLVGLNPTSGLEPAAREIYGLRMFAERTFFLMKRMPPILLWRVEDLMSRQSEEITTMIAEKVSSERESIMRDLEDQESRIQGLLKDVRATLTAADVLAQSLNVTTQTVDMFVSQFSDDEGDTPPLDQSEQLRADEEEGEPFDITEYTEAATRLSETTRELNELVAGVDKLLSSPALNQEESPLAPTINEATDNAERLLDLAFKYALILILVILAGTPVVIIIYRVVCQKLGVGAKQG
jgi:hypothetical protein